MQDGLEHYRDLLSIETVHVLNAALCEHHKGRCPSHPQMTELCDKADELLRATDEYLKKVEDVLIAKEEACEDANVSTFLDIVLPFAAMSYMDSYTGEGYIVLCCCHSAPR